MAFTAAHSFLVTYVILTFTAAQAVCAQQPQPPNARSVMGTYALGTRQFPSPSRDGCWLEVAPSTTDYVHVQVRCTMPAPSHHIGVMDQDSMPLHNGITAYQTNQFGGRCLIVVHFENARALVMQNGNAAECGFGANVNIAGTYRRISRRRPPFDLAPIERSSVQR